MSSAGRKAEVSARCQMRCHGCQPRCHGHRFPRSDGVRWGFSAGIGPEGVKRVSRVSAEVSEVS